MMTIDMIATGQNIKKIRKESGITIGQIVDTCGISKGSVCKWQRGDTMPSIDNFVVLASIFGVTIDDIIVTKTI